MKDPGVKSMNRVFALCLFPVLSLACSLTTPAMDQADPVSIPAQPTAQIGYESIAPIATQMICTVTATVLQIRECAGVSCRVKNWLEHGDVLAVQKKENGWILVTTPTHETGWVNSKYCGGM
jgi:uncharacterized protein YgiM (DUF1202 family)